MTDETAAICDLYNAIQAWFFLGKGRELPALARWAHERFERSIANS
jgi:hypothetical protein